VESDDAARASTCHQVEPVSEGFSFELVLPLTSRSILWSIGLSEPVCAVLILKVAITTKHLEQAMV
jgi:hypothetical protein